jgi:hypothetical protein
MLLVPIFTTMVSRLQEKAEAAVTVVPLPLLLVGPTSRSTSFHLTVAPDIYSFCAACEESLKR